MDYFKECGYTKDELLDALTDAMDGLSDLTSGGYEDYTETVNRLDIIWTLLNQSKGE